MTDTSRNRDPEVCTLKACCFEETKLYRAKVTGASVTTDSSVSLIYRYCDKLPGDRYGYFALSLTSSIEHFSVFPNWLLQNVGTLLRNQLLTSEFLKGCTSVGLHYPQMQLF